MLNQTVPVRHSGLPLKQVSDIERIQKVSFKIILQNKYVNYQQACKMFHTKTLQKRREEICLTFARKNIKSDNSLFVKTDTKLNTRNWRPIIEYKFNTRKFQKSSLPYMAKLVNTHYKAK